MPVSDLRICSILQIQMRYFYKALIALIALSLAACASVKQYDGAERPQEELATITKDSLRIHFRLVNGRSQGMYGNTVQVPPGPTVLQIGYQIANLASTSSMVVSFNAEAGKAYTLDYWREGMTWGVYLMDKNTNKVLAKGMSDAVLSQDVAKDARLKEFKMPVDVAGIYVYRNEVMGGQIKMRIGLDQAPLGETQQKTYLYTEVPPGKHTVTCSSENEDAIDIEASAAKLYFVWQEVKFGMAKPRCKLHVVEAQKGEVGVRESQLAVTARD